MQYIKDSFGWISITPEEIAKLIKSHFPDADEAILTTVAKRYKDQDAWSKDPILKKESLALLQEVMQSAGELKKAASYEALVNTDFAKKAIDKIKK